MKIADCIQYDKTWWSTRLGKPTGSMIGGVVGADGKRSKNWNRHVYRLAGERYSGKVNKGYSNEFTEHGHMVEPRARELYELITGRTVTQVGLVLRDDEQIGLSPDGLLLDRIQDPGGLEIKCPSDGVHVSYIQADGVPAVYRPQVYLGMYLTGYDWWDFMSYNEDFPPIIRRTYRDDPGYKVYSSGLDRHLTDFLDEIEFATNRIRLAQTVFQESIGG